MLKGSSPNFNIDYYYGPLSVSGNYTFFLVQDSIPVAPKPATPQPIQIKQEPIQINQETTRPDYTQAQLDSLLKVSERREIKIQQASTPVIVKKEIIINAEDTQAIRHNLYIYPFKKPVLNELLKPENIFAGIAKPTKIKNITKPETKQTKLIARNDSSVHFTQIQSNGFEGNLRHEAGFSWLPAILISTLFIFSWIKLMYYKYVVQVLSATVNYQVSNRLFRERNVLIRNMSLGLNTIFAINTGLLIFYLFKYLDIEPLKTNPFVSLSIYSISILTIYSIKTFFLRVLGFLFMVKEEFAEYIHNINLFNKNTGLLLFPVVILYPYINEHLKPVVLYAGITLFLLMILLRFFRGFQIIIRKGVSVFYLILYLCAIEILPVLLLIKLSSTSI